MTSNKNLELKVLFLIPLCLVAIQLVLLLHPTHLKAGNLTSASATLSNSRLSFYGKVVAAGVSYGTTTINIKNSGSIADLNTNHLFPADTVAIGVAGGETVGSIVDSDTFVIADALNAAASNDDAVYATQSGTLTITFTIANDIPAGGYVRVLIPDPASGGNDGAPDTADSTASNGFDLNGMATGDITTTGGTGCTWGTETLTAGSGSSHKYKVTTTTTCTAGAITVTFDGSSKDLVNPAPVYSGHTQGTADTYSIDVDTYDGDPDGTGSLIDTADLVVAPVEAVLVSATIPEALTFSVAGRASGTTNCGAAANVTTYAYSVPWGTLTAADTFFNAAQTLTVSTNADAGYAITVEEDDQMNKDYLVAGDVCDLPAGDTANYTDNCIQDTTCGSTACSESAARDWTVAATYPGLGFSLEDVSGTDVVFDYNGKPAETTCTSGTFCARQMADMQFSETKANILSATGPVNGTSARVCFRLAYDDVQPAGYYINKVKYIVTPTF